MLAFLFVSIFVGALPAQTPPANDCAVSGTVVNSLTNEPIAGAMISTGEHGSGAASDADGHWSVSKISCETIALTATHAGYFQAHYGESVTSGRVHGDYGAVQLVSGSPAKDLKMTMMPEGSVSGRVMDANENAIERADVSVKEYAVSGGKRVFVGGDWTATNSHGDFWIGRLRPGRYVVCANSSEVSYAVGGGAADVYVGSCFPGDPSGGAASTIDIRGREAQVSITLRAAHALHVRGKVTGANAEQEVRIELAKLPADPYRDRTADGTPEMMPFGHGGVAGRDGSFDIPNVPPGFYRVEALAGGRDARFAEGTVNVADTDIDDLRLALIPFGSVTGNVRFETSKPLPRGETPEISVDLAAGAGRLATMSAQWDRQNFTVPLVPPGEYFLTVSQGGNSELWVKSATLLGHDVLNQPLRSDGATGPVEIVMTDAVSGLNITTKDAKGNPADGIIVMKRAGGSAIFAQAQKGYLEKHGVPPGDYKVWAFDDLTTIPWADDEWMAQNAGPGEKVTVALGETANATVTITAAPTE